MPSPASPGPSSAQVTTTPSPSVLAAAPAPAPAAATSSPLAATSSGPVVAKAVPPPGVQSAPPPAASSSPPAPPSPSPSPDVRGELALPTHGSPPDRPAALWPGARLAADASAGCVWLVDDAGTRYAALWPVSWSADLGPLRLYDETGAAVWEGTGSRDISGGFSAVHVDRLPPACRTGERAWWVFVDE